MGEIPTAKDIYGLRFEKFKGDFYSWWIDNNWSTTKNAKLIDPSNPPLSFSEIVTEFEQAVNILLKTDLNDAERIEFIGTAIDHIDSFDFDRVGRDASSTLFGILEIINSIYRRIPPKYDPSQLSTVKIDWENVKDNPELVPHDLANRLREIDRRLNKLKPHVDGIGRKLSTISAAYDIADKFIAEADTVDTRKDEISNILDESKNILEEIKSFETLTKDSLDKVMKTKNDFEKEMQARNAELNLIIKKSNQALQGATGYGLAKAFESRRFKLTIEQILWILGLIISLGLVWFVGHDRLTSLKDVLSGSRPASVVWANVLLAAVGIGAPLWFVWLSTKRIGTIFQLTEDYAFKATVSRAYEGYRAEAVDIDPALRERLFSAALTRMEEAPIRLVAKETHSSPLFELLSRPEFRTGLEAVPNVIDKLKDLIATKGVAATAVIAPATAAGALAAAVSGEKSEEKT